MNFRSHPRHTQIRSYVMWDEIQQINKQTGQAGLYVWASLLDEATLNIQRLTVAFPERDKLKNSTEMHCTVIYSKTEPEQPALAFPDDRRGNIRASLVKLELWQDHKDRTLLVGLIQSETLRAYHQHFLRMGFKSDYPQYNPHITLAKDIRRDTPMQTWLESINAQIHNANTTGNGAGMIEVPMSGILHGSALT